MLHTLWRSKWSSLLHAANDFLWNMEWGLVLKYPNKKSIFDRYSYLRSKSDCHLMTIWLIWFLWPVTLSSKHENLSYSKHHVCSCVVANIVYLNWARSKFWDILVYLLACMSDCEYSVGDNKQQFLDLIYLREPLEFRYFWYSEWYLYDLDHYQNLIAVS